MKLALLIISLFPCCFLPTTLGWPQLGSSPNYLQNKSPSPAAVTAPGTSGQFLPWGGGSGVGSELQMTFSSGLTAQSPLFQSITKHIDFAFTFPKVSIMNLVTFISTYGLKKICWKSAIWGEVLIGSTSPVPPIPSKATTFNLWSMCDRHTLGSKTSEPQ